MGGREDNRIPYIYTRSEKAIEITHPNRNKVMNRQFAPRQWRGNYFLGQLNP